MDNSGRHKREDAGVSTPGLHPRAFVNEGKFWRKVVRGQLRLSRVQMVGIFLLYLTLVGVLWSTAYWEADVYPLNGTPLLAWIANRMGAWIILFVFFGILLFLFFWRVRRTLEKARYDRFLRQKKAIPDLRHH